MNEGVSARHADSNAARRRAKPAGGDVRLEVTRPGCGADWRLYEYATA